MIFQQHSHQSATCDSRNKKSFFFIYSIIFLGHKGLNIYLSTKITPPLYSWDQNTYGLIYLLLPVDIDIVVGVSSIVIVIIVLSFTLSLDTSLVLL